MTTPALDTTKDLADARAVVIGVGGLGCPASETLARAGIGALVLCDPDRVEVSNLHRQPLYGDADVGRLKVEVAAERLASVGHATRIEPDARRFDASALALLAGADVVVDGTDSIAAKFLVNDAAVALGIPLVHAGAVGFRAQLMTIVPGAGACYRCVFEEPPPPDDLPSCEDAGVLGPVVTLAGSLQGAEAVRLASGARPLFAGRIVTIDAWEGRWRSTSVARRPSCPACRPRADATRSHP